MKTVTKRINVQFQERAIPTTRKRERKLTKVPVPFISIRRLFLAYTRFLSLENYLYSADVCVGRDYRAK